jgi:glycosyltransferase involved in cell wall biosynthesis
LPLFGIKVVPALHCVLWPKYRRPGRLARLIIALDKLLFTRAAAALLTASGDIDDQLSELAGKRSARLRIAPFLPTYRSRHFSAPVAPPAAPPFRVLYAGRIVAEKGVFDLLKVAALLAADGRKVEFDICGTGSALDEMQRRAQADGLSASIRFHGHCNRPTMVEMFQNAHAVIVPTTTDFVEGFNQVVAEAILAGRPVVTSDVCPAIKYVGDAVVAVPPDDVPAYAKAIARLSDDAAFYQHCAAACASARAQFFDESRGWAAALHSALRIALPEVAA